MIIKIKKSDILKGQPISPDWYTLRKKEFRTKTLTDSINYIFDFQVCKNGTGEVDDNASELSHNFNSKAIGLMGNFIAACKGQSLKEVLDSMEKGTLDFDVDRDCPDGKLLMAKITNETYEGRLVNKIGDSGKAFLPAGSQVPF